MRRRRRGNRRLVVGVLALLLAFIIAVVQLDSRLRPLVQSYGYNAARRSAMLAVHQGVEAVLSAKDIQYVDLVSVEKGEDGRVLSAEANVTAINRLKASASNAVMEKLAEQEIQTVRIPLGSLLGGSFFTGRGPFLSLNIHTSGVVITDISSYFSDAGVNQTKHQIELDMTVMMTVALPLERSSIELKTSFLICDTVLIGEVPQSFMQLNLGNRE